jgi:hypothetical protein
MELVPGVAVLSSPWARFPNYLPNAVAHTSLVTASLASFWYLVMVSPVTGWMTGEQKWARLLAVLGRAAASTAMALWASWEMTCGLSRLLSGRRPGGVVSRGDLLRSRIGGGGAWERCLWVPWAPSELGRGGWTGGCGVAAGAVIGGTVPGVLLRVCFWCRRGAARTVAASVGVEGGGVAPGVVAFLISQLLDRLYEIAGYVAGLVQRGLAGSMAVLGVKGGLAGGASPPGRGEVKVVAPIMVGCWSNVPRIDCSWAP